MKHYFSLIDIKDYSPESVLFGEFLNFAVQVGWLQSPSAKVTAYIGRLRDRSAYQQSHTDEPIEITSCFNAPDKYWNAS